ncbi:YfcE family phosphodiesterase [Lysinibacillus sp. 2017]|uniref:YfcE family phosphodiesterase n=1 Tax=unclassified Lysinibacillus TaxID=2636778 RepID=UPI000D525945|nr:MULTISPECIES: metallophosphoesterase [unclassified Lysinibacillus]AWE08244.1 YfcE family phosphodiesterase [Lysinibacillus sp. 2017]TGN36253.1 metallophosphoesterase [Lysinibacillus sp. S2017]
MKLLVMSDTHGDVEVIERVKGYHPDAAKMIHCGDSELPYNHSAMQGLERVKGNCDHDSNYLEEIVFQVGEERVYVTHGHLYEVKTSPMKLVYRAKELGATIVCFGHSHILGAEYIDDIFFVNPGSLLKPRRIKEKSFVTITISKTHFILDCYDENNDLIEQMFIER